jgi:hypothetical protein
LDAGQGDVLINDGKGNFIRQDAFNTGLHLRGEVRDIKKIKVKSGYEYLFLQNNELPALFKINTNNSKK